MPPAPAAPTLRKSRRLIPDTTPPSRMHGHSYGQVEIRLTARRSSTKDRITTPRAGRRFRLAAALGALLEAVRELLERGAEVGHRAPDQRDQRAGVLLPHGEPRS